MSLTVWDPHKGGIEGALLDMSEQERSDSIAARTGDCRYHARQLREIGDALKRLHGQTETVGQIYIAVAFLEHEAALLDKTWADKQATMP